MIPTRIGQQFGGGYFTGINRIGQTAYAIIVEPNTLQAKLAIKTIDSLSTGTQSVNNGWANTVAMNNAEHPAAQYCRSLTVGSYTDWYLPSRDELGLCYRYLKPTTNSTMEYSTNTFSGTLGLANGTNLNSVPVSAAYTATNPSQTIVTAFCEGSLKSFYKNCYWSSTEFSTNTRNSLFQNFSDGFCAWSNKEYRYRVRAVRRVEIYSKETK